MDAEEMLYKQMKERTKKIIENEGNIVHYMYFCPEQIVNKGGRKNDRKQSR